MGNNSQLGRRLSAVSAAILLPCGCALLLFAWLDGTPVGVVSGALVAGAGAIQTVALVRPRRQLK
jgi:hypothetical protein